MALLAEGKISLRPVSRRQSGLHGQSKRSRRSGVTSAGGCRLVSCFPPVALVVEHGGMEDFFQLLNLFIGENILFRLTARPFVAVGDVRFKSASLPLLLNFADPRVAFRLARQQVNFFEIFPFFVLLHNELAVAGGGGELHLIQRPIVTSTCRVFPAANGCKLSRPAFQQCGLRGIPGKYSSMACRRGSRSAGVSVVFMAQTYSPE